MFQGANLFATAIAVKSPSAARGAPASLSFGLPRIPSSVGMASTTSLHSRNGHLPLYGHSPAPQGAAFDRLERELPKLLKQHPAALTSVIACCCKIKAEVVGQDEKETGLRAILNFGHTLGHGLEAISKYGKYLHGEAISIGQVTAAKISQAQTGLSEKDTARITTLFENAETLQDLVPSSEEVTLFNHADLVTKD